MSYRNVIIRKSEKISIEHSSLKIKRDSEYIRIPLEDIFLILIEDPFTILTTRFLSEISNFGITLICCDEYYLPKTQTIPLFNNYRMPLVLEKQIALQKRFKERMWKKIVKQKIKNQQLVISYTNSDAVTYEKLNGYIKMLLENDKSNMEGIAARAFFGSLYGNDFIRFSESPISDCLNYGYTILASAFIRTLTSLGLNTSLGIWHSSNNNYFNLAYDLIEPFRPVIDYYAYWNRDFIKSPLSKKTRADLVAILTKKVEINNEICPIRRAIEIVSQSFLRAIESQNVSELLLPTIKPIEFIYE